MRFVPLISVFALCTAIGCSGGQSATPTIVGKRVTFHESIKIVNSQILGVDFTSTYDIQYTAVIESELGEDYKLIIKSCEIIDPELGSMNYIETRSDALEKATDRIGDTTVKGKVEVEFVTEDEADTTDET